MGVVDEIKSKLDIVEVISEHASLQKAGRNFTALCPFHAEKHPSFFVFPERQSWHCFGACATGGDIFSFLMKKENMDFGQVLRMLAERTSTQLPTNRKAEDHREGRQRIHEMNEAASAYYHHLLLTAATAEIARQHLSKRGLTAKTIEAYQLGYSPEGYEHLKQYLITKGYTVNELVAGGLLSEKDGKAYDRFRNRLMFPISDFEGRMVGFGARSLDDSQPKYLNSPQTPAFDKGSIIYGIDRAKIAIRQRDLAIIVEGYMDVLMCHQENWPNVVASMGTSITARQLLTLKKLTRNLTMALDPDTAGEKATLRSQTTASETSERGAFIVSGKIGDGARNISVQYHSVPDINLRVAALPSGQDPDEVIKGNPEMWSRAIESAVPIIDFMIDKRLAGVDLREAKQKSQAADDLIAVISELENPIEQDHYVQMLAKRLDVTAESLRQAFKQYEDRIRRKTVRSVHASVPYIKQPEKSSDSASAEEYSLALLLQNPDLANAADELQPEFFRKPENREIFLQWKALDERSTLREKIDHSLIEHLDHLIAKKFPDPIAFNETHRHHAFEDCILRLQENWLIALDAEQREVLLLAAEKDGVDGQLSKQSEQGLRVAENLKRVYTRRKKLAYLKGEHL